MKVEGKKAEELIPLLRYYTRSDAETRDDAQRPVESTQEPVQARKE